MTTTREAALEVALTLARNRLQACAIDHPTGSREMAERSEWADEATAALSTPATEPQGYVVGPQFRALKTCKGCAHFKSEYWREPSGDGETYDSGTSADCLKAGRSISTYHGSEPAPPDWCPLAARPAPQPAADTRVVGYELSMNDEGGIYLKDRPDAGLVAIAVRDPEMPWRRNHPEAVDAIIARSAIIGNATPAQPDKIAEAARGGVRKAVASAIFDPGATEGYRGERTVTEWQTDAVMRALAGKGE